MHAHFFQWIHVLSQICSGHLVHLYSGNAVTACWHNCCNLLHTHPLAALHYGMNLSTLTCHHEWLHGEASFATRAWSRGCIYGHHTSLPVVTVTAVNLPHLLHQTSVAAAHNCFDYWYRLCRVSHTCFCSTICLVQGGQSTEQSKLAEDLLSSIAPRLGPILSVPSGFLASHVSVSPPLAPQQVSCPAATIRRGFPVASTSKAVQMALCACVCVCVRVCVQLLYQGNSSMPDPLEPWFLLPGLG